MKFVLNLVLFCGLLFSSSFAEATGITLNSRTENFINSDCAKTDSCDLKSAMLRQEDYSFELNAKPKSRVFYGTRMFMNYETSSMDSLEKYGVVQFIRGCQFSSTLENGKVVKEANYVIQKENGENESYYYPNWRIDGISNDPVEWGAVSSLGSRHKYYFNHFPGSSAPVKSGYYAYQKPEQPVLWLRDFPSIAGYTEELKNAHNISVEYKTCIYKTADVPRSVPFENVNFATPIHCFSWISSEVYNHETHKFESPNEVDPFCLGQEWL
jgi:hypothetical protein